MKFGCDPTYEAPSLLRLAHLLELDVVGISFHVGSGCQDPPVFKRAICHAKSLFDLATEIGFKPYLLDLGGGYPGNKGTSIDKIADVINHSLNEYFPCKSNYLYFIKIESNPCFNNFFKKILMSILIKYPRTHVSI